MMRREHYKRRLIVSKTKIRPTMLGKCASGNWEKWRQALAYEEKIAPVKTSRKEEGRQIVGGKVGASGYLQGIRAILPTVRCG